ncbi:hypothetical protein PAXRUDRAFT_15865 [Paxillus rubicundulus Ve08.2h10]|uniref:Uncharacterized protein n=1 Tax=Paxillus rubicundulus Ve08.2h10 TaxID=930991 RepID=A0A0D0DGB3_9AGAM|nr:hypothetical protein PAXRUDRAFT_15865 [Paxillus rubicundulus Ve08.2h10]
MSSSTANDITKWSNEQLHKNEDDDNNLYEKKSAEHRCHMKAQKEAEHRRAEEEMRQKAEEEAKRKAESSVSGPSKGKQPKAAVSRATEVMEQAGGLALCYGCLGAGVVCEMKTTGGDMQSMRRRKQEELILPWAGKKKAWTQSPVVDNNNNNEYEEKMEDEEAEEECDALVTLTEVLAVVVTEMWNIATDRRCILEEIQGCLDLEFTPQKPEVGSEEDFKEEEVAEAVEEREALKGWSEEEAEVDESM